MAAKENIVRVEWVDPFALSAGWHTLEEVKEAKPAMCISVGRIVYEDDEFLTLAGSWADPDQDYGEVFVIPKVVITNRKKLK